MNTEKERPMTPFEQQLQREIEVLTEENKALKEEVAKCHAHMEANPLFPEPKPVE